MVQYKMLMKLTFISFIIIIKYNLYISASHNEY